MKAFLIANLHMHCAYTILQCRCTLDQWMLLMLAAHEELG